MRRHQSSLSIAAAACALLAGCEKELDFEYRDIAPLMVVEGALTLDGCAVTITTTTPMGEPVDTTPLTDAAVTLTDLDTGDALALAPDTEGTYRAAAGGVTGHTYRLDVERGGALYSSTSVMGREVEITGLEFTWVPMPYDHVAILKVSVADDPATPGEYYWVRLYRDGEAYRWGVMNDAGDTTGEVSVLFMTTRADTAEEDAGDLLVEGDVVGVTVTAVSRAFADYLEALSNDSNGPALFTGPLTGTGADTGHPCLGYFLAAPEARASVTFHPDEIPGR